MTRKPNFYDYLVLYIVIAINSRFSHGLTVPAIDFIMTSDNAGLLDPLYDAMTLCFIAPGLYASIPESESTQLFQFC